MAIAAAGSAGQAAKAALTKPPLRGKQVTEEACLCLMTDEKSTAAPDPEIVYVTSHRISCNGGGGALGHPLVYYSLEDGEAECGYCDRKFIYRAESDGQAPDGVS